jgi:hypothetical protein
MHNAQESITQTNQTNENKSNIQHGDSIDHCYIMILHVTDNHNRYKINNTNRN